MSRALKKTTGVIVREMHLQVDLRAYGYGRERLNLAPTPANIQYAARLRLEILAKIERGTFALADYFPESPRAAKDVQSLTFKQLAGEWLRVKRPEVQHSTFHHYEQTLSSYHFADLMDVRTVDLNYRALMNLLADFPKNGKTFNNVASVLRQVLEYGFKAKLLAEPLHDHVEMRRYQKPGPDPYTLQEAQAIIQAMPEGAPQNYYELAFFSGMRPSEQIALQWAKVDLKAGKMVVDAAITRGEEKGTKTGVTRTVELTGNALEALKRQRAISNQGAVYVFEAGNGKPLASTDAPLDAWWRPTVTSLDVRYRDARQTRHTFATMCLMAGITPGWVATQMGHSIEMFFRVYSRWIEGADYGAERRKLESFVSSQPPNR